MDRPVKVNVHNSSLGGGVWFIGWLFTVGYLKFGFWKGVLALIVWPYFIGEHFAPGAE